MQRFEFRESHMGSEFIVSLYCADEDVASAASRAAFDRIAELDAILSDYDVDSELSRLSDRAGGPAVPVSERPVRRPDEGRSSSPSGPTAPST